jgi:hypothetical protein
MSAESDKQSVDLSSGLRVWLGGAVWTAVQVSVFIDGWQTPGGV